MFTSRAEYRLTPYDNADQRLTDKGIALAVWQARSARHRAKMTALTPRRRWPSR
jgi:tRNA U34 5-carboxymethylaminomethyl modifying enzyme MnmG/GidA